MARIYVPPEVVKSVVGQMLLEKGGLTALAAGKVPEIVDEWTENGISLYVDTDKPLGRALLKEGVIRE